MGWVLFFFKITRSLNNTFLSVVGKRPSSSCLRTFTAFGGGSTRHVYSPLSQVWVLSSGRGALHGVTLSQRTSHVRPGALLSTCPFPRSLETSNPAPGGPSRVPGHLSRISRSGETPCQSPVPAHNHPPTHTHAQTARMPVRDLHSPTKPHPCPRSEMPRWEPCPGHRSFPTRPSRFSMPRDTLMCRWGVHTPKHTARFSGPLSWLRQHSKSWQAPEHPTRLAALIVQSALEQTVGEPGHGAGGSSCVVYHTRKTGVLESS